MTDYVTPTTWEQCAAHVEAGGIVEVFDGFDEWLDEGVGPSDFRSRSRRPGDGRWDAPRRLVPIESAAPAPESSTGIGEGEAVRAYYRPTAERLRAISEVMTAERLRDEAAAPVTGDDLRDAVHLLDLAWGVIANADGWNDDTSWRQAAERWRDGYHRLLDDIRTTAPAPPPVPPWPGAVLSGLCDEDGVPTWLAQAGQVRGEQVRRRSDFMWVNNDQMVAHLDTVWVEVRAPRAVPEPETERVQLGVAVVGGLLAICREGGTLDLGRGDVKIHTENGASVASTSESMFTVEIDPDGTVEVLKDGES